MDDYHRGVTHQIRGIHIIIQQAIEKYTSYQDEQDSVARGDRLKLVLDQGSDIRQGSFHIIGCSHIYDLK